MEKKLQFSYWFDVYGAWFAPVLFWLFLIGFSACLVIAIILATLRKKKYSNRLVIKKMLTKLIHWFTSLGIFGLILFSFKHYRVPYFGMRVWLVLWLLICFVWLLFILKFIMVEVPKLKKKQTEEREFKKYLP